jgi:hypothetical protein
MTFAIGDIVNVRFVPFDEKLLPALVVGIDEGPTLMYKIRFLHNGRLSFYGAENIERIP